MSDAFPIVPNDSYSNTYNSNVRLDQTFPDLQTTMGNYIANINITEVSGLQRFAVGYRPIHGYLAITVCVFGVLANVLNIVVLTQKNMQTSTNVILTGLAISDALTMAAYFPYVLVMYVIHGTDINPERDTYSAAAFQMSYAIFSVVVHSISIWLTVTLAVFRYVFIRFPRRGARYCNIEKAKLAVIIVVIVVTIVCIPNSVSYRISHHTDKFRDEDGVIYNGTVYYVKPKQETEFEETFTNLNFWIQALLIKLLPCFLLTIFSILLISTMRDAERRRKKLLNNLPVSDAESGATSSGGGNSRKHKKSRSNRTTKMLLTVVILFLITETPQGVLSVLSSLIDGFFDKVYTPLGDLLDIMALINNGINFVLYCTMSKQFRDTFIKIFVTKVLRQEYNRNKTTYVTTQATQATRDSDV
ncbi:hypothetical protein FSP39_000402 [Pinctada imbricata]|uniref:G-protein coupled receptors family 1 profile domain-containing protein n=1 Tax=Pinctada imbricata TaxID=66713 RepID=A0AA88YFZ4_PINIB|nr:hypothetical protein FSP39_000402 [Pinctada imbricata]